MQRLYFSMMIVLLLGFNALAQMTTAQLNTLKTDITVTNAVEFAPALAATDDQAIANAYNLTKTPDFWVLRRRVSRDEIVNSTSAEGTVFTHVGNGFISRSQGEFEAWRNMFDRDGEINPSLPQVQVSINDVFSGTGNAALNRAHMAVIFRRKALRIERLFATGTGSVGTPGVMGFEGTISGCDVARALRNAC